MIPIRTSAAFHPKIAIFVGAKRASILVGSHNLTVAGFGYNRELTNLIELSAKKQDDSGNMVSDIWGCLVRWLESASGYCPPELIQNALSLQKHMKPFINAGAVNSSGSFLSQSAGEIGLFAKLKESVNFEVRRVLVIGAFFDQKLAFLKAIRSTWPGAEIVVGIDPDTVYLPLSFGDAEARFVDIGTLWPEDNGSYLHAKAVYIEGVDTQRVFLSGSANPSGPGWGLDSAAANTEAVILLKDGNAIDALIKTGLDGLFGLPAISVEKMQLTMARASQLRISTQQSAPRIVVGTADGEARRITVKCPDAQSVTGIVPLDDNDGLISIQSTFTVVDSTVEIIMAETAGAIRSLLLGKLCAGS